MESRLPPARAEKTSTGLCRVRELFGPRGRHRRAAALLLLGLAVAAALPADSFAAGTQHRSERVLPRFAGPRLGGGFLSSDLLKGRRGLIYVFATTDRSAAEMAKLVQRLSPDASAANIAVLGVNRDLNPAQVEPFVGEFLPELPVIVDTDLAISRKLQVPPGESAVFLIDAEGFILVGFAGMPERIDDPAAVYEAEFRNLLHLPASDPGTRPLLGTQPPAPPFEVRSLDGDALSLEQLRGKVVALVFFLPSCPHCHSALRFLDTLKKKLGDDDFQVVSVSIRNRPFLIEEMRDDLEIELPLYTDADSSTQRAYEHKLGVPDIVLIDRQGKIVARFGGTSPRVEAMLTMEVRQALGVPNPILLSRTGYSGSDMCQACHRDQHSTWALTPHAHAFETLLEHGEERNPECIGCHSVGFDKPGGYSLEETQPELQGVQCENCHGRGGPHQSPDFMAEQGGYAGICADCHTETHSLHFVFGERLPEVSHAANLRFASLTVDERRAFLKQRDRRQRTLFQKADYVGSDTCQACHSSEYALWKASPHASAMKTLERHGQAADTDCQRCHTTGFGEAGGFPSNGQTLANVGCESCHGPGGAHAGPDQRKSGTILTLTDKCDSCVILQICGSCHDDANDPGFEFELEQKLERIRHGFGSRPGESAAE